MLETVALRPARENGARAATGKVAAAQQERERLNELVNGSPTDVASWRALLAFETQHLAATAGKRESSRLTRLFRRATRSIPKEGNAGTPEYSALWTLFIQHLRYAPRAARPSRMGISNLDTPARCPQCTA